MPEPREREKKKSKHEGEYCVPGRRCLWKWVLTFFWVVMLIVFVVVTLWWTGVWKRFVYVFCSFLLLFLLCVIFSSSQLFFSYQTLLLLPLRHVFSSTPRLHYHILSSSRISSFCASPVCSVSCVAFMKYSEPGVRVAVGLHSVCSQKSVFTLKSEKASDISRAYRSCELWEECD